jgi:hypothetical protein
MQVNVHQQILIVWTTTVAFGVRTVNGASGHTGDFSHFTPTDHHCLANYEATGLSEIKRVTAESGHTGEFTPTGHHCLDNYCSNWRNDSY